MQPFPKQSRYVRSPVLEVLCTSLCGPRTKSLETRGLIHQVKKSRIL